ncbi:hypothetical protein EJB05_40585, partial [Eragrostis curvula]
MEEKWSTMTTTSTWTLRTRLALPQTTPVEMEDTLHFIAAYIIYRDDDLAAPAEIEGLISISAILIRRLLGQD